jgi:hypothetical protein
VYDALKVDFISEHRLVVCRPAGVIDDYFAIQLLNFLLALEEVSEPFNRLLDLTLTTDITLSSKKIQEYAEARVQATAHLPPFRTAIIADRPETEAAARLYATLVKGSKIEVWVFGSTGAAAHWLDVPDDIVRASVLSPSRSGIVKVVPQKSDNLKQPEQR